MSPERGTYWDPLRRKEVAATPEEQVRQWFIGILERQCKVPRHQMMSEVQMRFGTKPWRADILVYDHQQQPLAIVECKRETQPLDAGVMEQALRYHAVQKAPYVFLTNGAATCAFLRGPQGFSPLDHLPDYEEMNAATQPQ